MKKKVFIDIRESEMEELREGEVLDWSFGKENQIIFSGDVCKVCQCGSCETVFPEEYLKNMECPVCDSGNWVHGYTED